MSQGPLLTFHPLPRLPLELRSQIWESASVHGCVVKVRTIQHPPLYNKYFSSPTPVPGVTRVSHESHKFCSYQRYFRDEVTQRYIWVNFANDVLHMDSVLMYELVTQNSVVVEKNVVRHLRIDLAANFDPRFGLSEFFYHDASHRIQDMLRLQSCDVVVHDGLMHTWTQFIKERYGGVFPRNSVRMIDGETGEWIDEETAGPYQDYNDTNGGETRDYTRIARDWDEEDEEEAEERYEEMMEIGKEPLPRVNLSAGTDVLARTR